MVTPIVVFPAITTAFVAESHIINCSDMALAANLAAVIDNSLTEDDNYLRVLRCAGATGRKDLMVGIKIHQRIPDVKLHQIAVLIDNQPFVTFTQKLFVDRKGEVKNG